MKSLLFFRYCLLFFLASSSVLAGSKAIIEIQNVNISQWPAHYLIKMDIPEHHHAYLDKGVEQAYIPITLDRKNTLAQQNLAVYQFNLPKGNFDNKVQATVLRGKSEFTLVISHQNQVIHNQTATVNLRYQLCNEVTNVCFRPQTKKLTFELPLANAKILTEKPANIVVESSDNLTLMEQLLAVFNENKNNTLLLFLLMLLAGLLSVATPCVYPMIPITSMLIVNRAQGDQTKEKYHAFVYLIGIVGTYILLGIMAGMTGGAFNSFMQSAVVNLAFAAFFAFFAISLLGYYEFSFMQNEVGQLDQNTSKVTGYFGTWLMGSIAGLVISPCVGPIVFALLLQIADNIAIQTEALALLGETLSFWTKLTISLQGGVLMGGFGLGVALPFFLVSVIKFKKLPKAGYWMNKVKYAFGFAILYFAYTYFAKGLGVLHIPNNIILVLAWGLIILWIAIVHCNILDAGAHDQHPTRRLTRYIGVVTFILGGWLLITGLNHIPFMPQNNHTITTRLIENTTDEGGIHWEHDFIIAKEKAKQSNKPIFIDFYASWCANCLDFAKETINHKALNLALREHAIPLKIIDNTPEFERFKQHPDYRQLKIGLPYFAILNSQGKLEWSGTDYQAIDTMLNVIKRLNNKAN